MANILEANEWQNAGGGGVTFRPNGGVNPRRINTFFGLTTRTANNELLVRDQDITANFRDMALRNSGIGKELKKNERLIAGLQDPVAYLNAKQQDLLRVGEELGNKYYREYQTALNLGLSQKQAKERAIEFADLEKKKLLEEHEINFPTNATKTALLKQQRRALVN